MPALSSHNASRLNLRTAVHVQVRRGRLALHRAELSSAYNSPVYPAHKGTLMINNNSTGPRTDIGKQTSSKNALEHGSCSFGTLILQSESLDDFLALEKRWFQGYGVHPNKPKTSTKPNSSAQPPAPTGSTSAPTATTAKSKPK